MMSPPESRFHASAFISHISPQCVWNNGMIHLLENILAPQLFWEESVIFIPTLIGREREEEEQSTVL